MFYALEVLVDGEVIRVCVPPEGGRFSGVFGNATMTFVRASVFGSNERERYGWKLPDLQPGQVLSFRMVAADSALSGSIPDEIETVDPEEAG